MTRRTTPRPARRAALVAGCLLASTLAARAGEAGDCFGYGDLKDRPDLAIARIEGADRTFFVKSVSDSKTCPGATDQCRAKAYLVPGNRVIASVTRNGFTCADYVGAKGADRAGWLPSTSLVREEPVAIKPEDWIGTWTREEAEVTIRSAPGGRLAVKGDATYGSLDPDRVKRGAVNVGEMKADAAPDGAHLAFNMDGEKTLPVDRGDASDCKVWMRRLGSYLLVDDNNNCGGMNVTFRGIYLRKP